LAHDVSARSANSEAGNRQTDGQTDGV